jgi:hypothetical protein
LKAKYLALFKYNKLTYLGVNKNLVYKPNKFKAKHMAGFKFNEWRE